MIFNMDNRNVNIDDALVKKYKETMLEDLSQEMVTIYLNAELEFCNKKIESCTDKELSNFVESSIKKDIQGQEV